MERLRFLGFCKVDREPRLLVLIRHQGRTPTGLPNKVLYNAPRGRFYFVVAIMHRSCNSAAILADRDCSKFEGLMLSLIE
jgi:hypothetical protein